MAFMGIILMWLAVIFGILGFLFFVSVVCFVLSAAIKRRYEKRISEGVPAKRPASITVLKIAGWIFLVPAVGIVLLIIAAIADGVMRSDGYKDKNDVPAGYEQAAEIVDTDEIN